MNGFIKWLGTETKVISITKQSIAKTLTVTTVELENNRRFVSADRALVSYDNGFYQSYEKGDETDLLIEHLINN